MNTVRIVAKNTIALSIGDIGGKVIGFFFTMYTARYLGAEGFGILSLAVSLSAIFAVSMDLGLQQLTIREVARDRSLAKKYIGNITVIKLVLCTATFGLIALAVNLLGYPEQIVLVVYLVSLSVVCTAFTQMFNSIFQAYENMEFVSIGNILNSILLLSGALLAIVLKLSVVSFAFLYLIASAIVLAYSLIVSVIRLVTPKAEIDLGYWKLMMLQALPFGLTWFFGTIYYRISCVMLSVMKDMTTVGWYNAAYSLVLGLLFIPFSFLGALFPVMSRLYATYPDTLKMTCERAFKYMLVIGVPISAGTTILADRFIYLIYQSDYEPSIIALQILIWSNLFIYTSLAIGYLFNAINRQIIPTVVTGFGMVVNILLNLYLIPRFGYVGASITTVITELVILLILLGIASRSQYAFSYSAMLKYSLKVIVSVALMSAFLYYPHTLNIFILITLSVIIYFGSFYILRGFDRDDIRIAKSIVGLK